MFRQLHPTPVQKDLRDVSAEDMAQHRALTSGSGIWENTKDQHWDRSTAPQPHRRSWGGHTGCSPTILSPSFFPKPPCPVFSSSSWCFRLPPSVCPPALAPFTGQEHNGPWGWLIVDMLLKSTHSCLFLLHLYLLLFYQKHYRNQGKGISIYHCNQLLYNGGEPALQLG